MPVAIILESDHLLGALFKRSVDGRRFLGAACGGVGKDDLCVRSGGLMQRVERRSRERVVDHCGRPGAVVQEPRSGRGVRYLPHQRSLFRALLCIHGRSIGAPLGRFRELPLNT
jgi:hypothetical protein